MAAPEQFETSRLILRRPTRDDVAQIFERYANDPEVTRYIGWPRHRSLEQTRAFLDFSDSQWSSWPAGPYLIESRASGTLLGGTGLGFETAQRAMTGYVFARDAWGQGFATEALAAMVDLSERLDVRYLYALCHREHTASRSVLIKCGFILDPIDPPNVELPNIGTTTPQPIVRYVKTLEDV